MRILRQDANEGILRLRLDNADDLWHLAQLVRRGDVVSGMGAREPLAAKEAAGEAGKGKVAKKAMWLGVRADEVEFQEFSTRLRVLGVIVEGPQDHSMHHALAFEAGDEVEVKKERWPAHALERVKEAVESTKRPQVVVLAIEDNEATLAALRSYGVQRLVDVTGHASGKRYAAEKGAKESFFEDVLMAVKQHRPPEAPLVVVGPGFAREEFLRFAAGKDAEAVRGAMTEGTGQAGMTGVHEAVKRGIVERVQKDQRVSFETRLVEGLLEGMATDGAVAYGHAEVARMVELGAAETVLVTDERLREAEAERLLEAARATGATPHVVSTLHEAGRKLASLGGYGALLRYKPAA